MQSIRKLTRRLILLLLLFPSLALAQIDIPVQTLGNYFSAGSNLAWGASGAGGFNNNFILPGLGGITTNMCVFVQNNNPTSAHNFLIRAYVNSDPRTTSYTGNTSNWSPLQINGPFVSTSSNNYTVEAKGTTAFGPAPFLIVGATGANVAISLSQSSVQSGTPDTASVWGMYTYGTSCSAYVSGNPTFSYFNSTVTGNGTSYVFGKEPTSLYMGDPSSFSSCTFNVLIANNSGTTPTLNLYVQNANEIGLGMKDDRISFLQATTGSSFQEATISLGGNANPHVVATNSLAAGTINAGKFTDEIVLSWVLGGTSPSYALTVIGHCN